MLIKYPTTRLTQINPEKECQKEQTETELGGSKGERGDVTLFQQKQVRKEENFKECIEVKSTEKVSAVILMTWCRGFSQVPRREWPVTAVIPIGTATRPLNKSC